jgi:hypothetical protein
MHAVAFAAGGGRQQGFVNAFMIIILSRSILNVTFDIRQQGSQEKQLIYLS